MNDKEYLAQFESYDDLGDWANNKPIPTQPAPKPAPKPEPVDPRVLKMTADELALYEKLKHNPEKRVKMLKNPAGVLAAYNALQTRKAQLAESNPQ